MAGTEMPIPVKLYRYMPLRDRGFEHIADIIINKRFHTALHCEFNDAMEGKWRTDRRPPLVEYRYDYSNEDLKKDLKRLRVCCFCWAWDNLILWAQCADAFKGICIEFQVMKRRGYINGKFSCRRGVDFYRVQYDTIPKIPESCHLHPSTGRHVLSHKTPGWSFEDEVRIISPRKYIPFRGDIKIRRILLGPKIEPVWKPVIEKLITPDDPDKVQVRETKINDAGKVEVI